MDCDLWFVIHNLWFLNHDLWIYISDFWFFITDADAVFFAFLADKEELKETLEEYVSKSVFTTLKSHALVKLETDVLLVSRDNS